MWKFSIKVFLLLLFFALQSVTLRYISLEFVKPDLAIPFLAFEAFFSGWKSAILMAVIAGLFQEGFSISPPCTLLLAKITVLAFLFLLRGTYYIESSYVFGLTCGAMDVFQSLWVILVSLIAKGESRGLFDILFYLLPNFTFTSLFSIGIFQLLDWVSGRPEEKGWT